jgi:uncharacterized membrane protein YvbJ
MPYCPKCGNNVDETMAFCPKCGTALGTTTTQPTQTPPESQPAPESEKQEKQEKPEIPTASEIQVKNEKNQYGFVYYLIGGLILIIVGVFAIIFLTSRVLESGQDVAILLIIIGLIIIIGAIYVHTPVEKYFRRLFSHPKNSV